MKPISPVIPGWVGGETVFAKDQDEYLDLPAIVCQDGTVITRWRLGWVERLRVLFRGDVYLSILTFGNALQPIRIQTEIVEVSPGKYRPTAQKKA